MPEDIQVLAPRPLLNRRGLVKMLEEANAMLAEPLPTKGKKGEDLFHLILSGIREVYDVEAVIAGGAVRDLAAGIDTPNDVDVFIPLTVDDFFNKAEELGWQTHPVLLNKKPYDKCAVKSTGRAQARVQGTLVDLVFLPKPLTMEDVSAFPVFAQRAVWTLKEGMRFSPEATRDNIQKTFTIDPTITDKDKLKRLKEKVEDWLKRPGYKGWKLVEPDVKEWWELKEDEKKKKVVKQSKTITFSTTGAEAHFDAFWNNN